jgi:hypothetical protein
LKSFHIFLSKKFFEENIWVWNEIHKFSKFDIFFSTFRKMFNIEYLENTYIRLWGGDADTMWKLLQYKAYGKVSRNMHKKWRKESIPRKSHTTFPMLEFSNLQTNFHIKKFSILIQPSDIL